MLGEKLRFRFAKTGTIRLLSHHDLMRCTERILRRVALPFKSTAGYHPTPRIVFALSLPLGVEGLSEVVELEFTRELSAERVLATLNDQSPAGLRFTRVSVVPLKATAIPRRVVYSLPLPTGRTAETAGRCAEFMAQAKVWVNRLRPGPKRLNIRPYFRSLNVLNNTLSLDLWVTQTGTARADELLSLLNVADLLHAGTVVTRTTVEIHDEVPNPEPADVPPIGPAETLPLEPAAIAALTQRDEEESATVGWGASPAGPVVE